MDAPPADGHPIYSFLDEFFRLISCPDLQRQVGTGHLALSKMCSKYTANMIVPDVNRRTLKSFFISLGANLILDGVAADKGETHNNTMARAIAEALVGLEDYETMREEETAIANRISELLGEMPKFDQVTIRTLRDLNAGDRNNGRALIRFFAKRVPCSCLQEKLAKVNVQPKMGLCFHCCGSFEFQALMKCNRCKIVHYCSKACQVANWPTHKESGMCQEVSPPMSKRSALRTTNKTWS